MSCGVMQHSMTQQPSLQAHCTAFYVCMPSNSTQAINQTPINTSPCCALVALKMPTDGPATSTPHHITVHVLGPDDSWAPLLAVARQLPQQLRGGSPRHCASAQATANGIPCEAKQNRAAYQVRGCAELKALCYAGRSVLYFVL